MNQSQSIRKIVWAVDPFSDEAAFIRSTARTIAAISRQGGKTEVQPVYVRLGAPPRKLRELWPDFISDLRKNAQYALDSKLGRTLLPELRPLQVLRNEHSTLRTGAKLVTEHARDLGAELIVLSSHGRKGLSRAILGSFAETLSLISEIPLLIAKPGGARAAPDLKEILFLTDFSEESQAAFQRLLDFAEPYGSRVAILHKIGQPPYPVFELGHAFYAAYEKALDDEAAETAKAGKKLAALAKARGLRAEVIIDRTPGSIASSTRKLAAKRRAMIALAAQSGPVSAAILGNTAWQVLRDAEQPVWVIHPAPAEKEREAFALDQSGVEKDLRLPLSS